MPKYHAKYVKEHYVKRDIRRELYEAFIEWCGERSINICLEKALNVLRGNIAAGVRENIAPNTGVNPSKPNATAGEGYEWCRGKARVRSLQSFIKWVDEHFDLIDWWDEGDRYCFKTRRKPAKTE
jgi:hypothetical protein